VTSERRSADSVSPVDVPNISSDIFTNFTKSNDANCLGSGGYVTPPPPGAGPTCRMHSADPLTSPFIAQLTVTFGLLMGLQETEATDRVAGDRV